jgi:hypothetical protein
MLRIDFVKSRSKQFPEALKVAMHFEGYSEKDGVYSVKFSQDDIFLSWDEFSRFHHMVTAWAGTNVYFKGKLLKPYNNRLYYALQEIIQCIKGESFHHCKTGINQPGWGCVKLNRIKRHIEYYSYIYWYSFGEFSQNMKSWQVDKGKLLSALMSDAEGMNLTLCPLFKSEKVKEAVSGLPDKINIGKEWEIVFRDDFVGDRIGSIPVGIRHIVSDTPVPFIPEKSVDDMSNEEIDRLIDEKLKRQK